MIKLEKHWGVSAAAVCGIGPELALNSSSVPIQGLIQKSFNTSFNLSLPLILSLLSIAIFVPLGPILRHRIGARNNYFVSIITFIIGCTVCVISSDMMWFCIGRVLQGMGTGMLFMMMIPMLVLSFPLHKRDLAIIVLTGGLFGSAIAGQYWGYVATGFAQFKFLYMLAGLVSLLGLVFSQIYLNNEHSKEHSRENSSVDKIGYSLLVLFGLCYSISLFHLQNLEGSTTVGRVGVIGSILFFLFFLYRECKQETPMLAFKEIISLKMILVILLLLIVNFVISMCFIGTQEILRQFGLLTTGWGVISLCIIMGLLMAILINYLLYDRFGPGYLAMIGSFLVFGVSSFIALIPAENISLIFVAICLVFVIAGIGVTTVSGLLGVALGGALPKLVQRMTVVQFIRFAVAGIVPILNGVIMSNIPINDLREENLNEVEWGNGFIKSMLLNKMTNYQEYFFISSTLSFVLICLSMGIALTGKGHKLAHKSHSVKERIIQ